MSLSEDDIIATLFAPLAGPGGFSLRDDAAVVSPKPNEDLVVTVDALVAGVHFFADDPPDAIAAKALGVNLSDLAAKAAEPAGFLLALALPRDWTPSWLESFARGLGETAALHGCPLLGGDTVRTPGPLTLSITAFGTVPRGRMLPRTGARPGDVIYVSGTIGDAALGLVLRRDEGAGLASRLGAAAAHLRARYLRPEPRLALRDALRGCANAGMDVSDGLIGDVSKMLRASAMTGRIDLSRVPLSPAVHQAVTFDDDWLVTALTGGDDYEILATIPEPETARFEAAAAKSHVPVTRIGIVLPGQDPPQFHETGGRGVVFDRGSFSHF